ncbi:hypothetical protein ASE07_10100 [Noviherbaspirillum sp. Root189]|nr:hypothetical protein ASE07_10100 [Noviherbaspirillum sp. Root189]
MILRSLRAFFKPWPALQSPLLYCLLVTLAGAAGGTLTGKTHCPQYQPHTGLAIRNAKLALNELSNPAQCPDLGVESVGLRAAQHHPA